MSFFKKLFGSGSTPEAEKSTEAVEYNGFLIRATPYSEGGQYQLCGVIEKEMDGAVKSYRFVRAEKFASRSEADEFTVTKAKQIIDQIGLRIFQN